MGKYMAKLTFLWYDYFGEIHTPLHGNVMTAIPKTNQQSPHDQKFQVMLRF